MFAKKGSGHNLGLGQKRPNAMLQNPYMIPLRKVGPGIKGFVTFSMISALRLVVFNRGFEILSVHSLCSNFKYSNFRLCA